MRTSDRTLTITSDLVVGHKYEVKVQAIGPDGVVQPIENSVGATIVIRGKLDGPETPSTLTATGFLNSIVLAWVNPADPDFDCMRVYRSETNDVSTAEWIRDVFGDSYIDPLGAPNLTRYYWIKAENSSGITSGFWPQTVEGVGATTEGVAATDIDDFAITATKMFTNTVVLTADVWTNNSPGAGSVAWNAHNIVYNGASYPITAGNTSSYYVYWTIGAATYTGSATHPVLGTTAFMIAVNQSGIHTMVWNSSANMVIGTAFIANLAVTEAKIANLSVTAGKIGNLAVTSAKIALLAVGNAQINDLSADKINVGTLTGRTVQTAATGQRFVVSSADNRGYFYTATGLVVTIGENAYSGQPGLLLAGPSFGNQSVVHLANSYDSTYTSISSNGSMGMYSNGDCIYAQSYGNPPSAVFTGLLGSSYSGDLLRLIHGVTTRFAISHLGNLDLDGSITMDASETVDGVDVSTLPGLISAKLTATNFSSEHAVNSGLRVQTTGGTWYLLTVDAYGRITEIVAE